MENSLEKARELTFSVAPMMDCTDRHCRFFLRLISRRARLYTEMITAEAILQGDRDYLLSFSAEEHPLACQLGGSDPARLAQAARIVAAYGYDEINLNVGCPSSRVREGRFGACLMAEPDLVGRCVEAMREVVDIPVTVKCRIGIDDQDPHLALFSFIDEVSGAGCTDFIVHARKAWLNGLSPKDNRTIPPLDYDVVRDLKTQRPHLKVILNGGITSLVEVRDHLKDFDGVMVGRAAYAQPWLLHEVDALFGEAANHAGREDVLEQYLVYVERECARGVPLHAMTRHTLGIFHGVAGAREFRRRISTAAVKAGAGPEVLREALADMRTRSSRAA